MAVSAAKYAPANTDRFDRAIAAIAANNPLLFIGFADDYDTPLYG